MVVPSGKFVLRLPPGLHGALRTAASDRGLSLNRYCVELLKQGLQDLRAAAGPDERLGSGVVPARVLDRIGKVYGKALEGIILFGSAARGLLWQSSDIDLLIVLGQGKPIERQLYRIWDDRLAGRLQALPNKIAPQFVAMPERMGEAGGIWFDAALEGVVLVDPLLRLSRLMGLLRQEMLAGRVVRKLVHGQPYWVRLHSRKGKAA